jgi:serine/threonine protein kinase
MFKSATEDKTHLENFLDLVQRMLVYDPDQRITPTDALNHPFILNGPTRITKSTAFTNPFSRPTFNNNNNNQTLSSMTLNNNTNVNKEARNIR